MKLYQLFERTIKVPQELKEDVLRMAVYAVYHYHARGGRDEDVNELKEVIEDTTGYDVDVLEMELSGRFKRSVSTSRDYYGITVLNPEEVPYYHSSQLVRNNVDSHVNQQDALVIDVSIMVRENDVSSFKMNKGVPHVLVNAFEFSGEVLNAWFGKNEQADKKARIQYNKLKSVIDHELQHLVQEIGLHKDQSAIKKNYTSGERSEDKVHNDYFTSAAEIRPHLANLEQDFRSFVEGDDWWDKFDLEQRKEFFRMFVGLSEEGFDIKVGENNTMRVKIPAKRYFKALKKDSPKLYMKVVKDFYQRVADILKSGN
jgi:hypothetical protein